MNINKENMIMTGMEYFLDEILKKVINGLHPRDIDYGRIGGVNLAAILIDRDRVGVEMYHEIFNGESSDDILKYERLVFKFDANAAMIYLYPGGMDYEIDSDITRWTYPKSYIQNENIITSHYHNDHFIVIDFENERIWFGEGSFDNEKRMYYAADDDILIYPRPSYNFTYNKCQSKPSLKAKMDNFIGKRFEEHIVNTKTIDAAKKTISEILNECNLKETTEDLNENLNRILDRVKAIEIQKEEFKGLYMHHADEERYAKSDIQDFTDFLRLSAKANGINLPDSKESPLLLLSLIFKHIKPIEHEFPF